MNVIRRDVKQSTSMTPKRLESMMETGGNNLPEGNIPAGFALTEIVRTDVPGTFGLTAICEGLYWQVIPLGRLGQVKKTVPLKLFCELTLRLNVAILPTGIVAEVGDRDPVNVGVGTTTSWAAALCISGPLTPITVKVYVPGATLLRLTWKGAVPFS